MKLVRGFAFVGVVVGASACNDTMLTAVPPGTEPPEAVIQSTTAAYSPLDTAQFSGTASSDPDGAIVAYAWTIVARPSGSNSTIEPFGDGGASAEFFVDFAGDYTVELTVTDDTGLTDSTTYAFSAVPWQTVHVELAWDIDVSDVDLHLTDEAYGGTFGSQPGDCYYSNKSPDWGAPGAENNPTLDIDDVDGFGPENINITQPRDGSRYRVLVHYYSDDGVGGTNATVRIYLNGQIQFEQVKYLSQTNKVWDVATIDWPAGAITEIGTIFDTSGID